MTNNINIPSHGSVSSSKTTQQIKAEGEIKIKVIVLTIIGVLLAVITVGGIAGLIINEATFGKYWQGLQAIISGAIFGLVGFVAGQKVGSGE